MKIKICGLKFESNIIDLSKLEPDYMGFIFWEKSKRYVKGSTPNLSETKIKNFKNFFGKRFAAKEATWKALCPNRGDGLFFREIEIFYHYHARGIEKFSSLSKTKQAATNFFMKRRSCC